MSPRSPLIRPGRGIETYEKAAYSSFIPTRKIEAARGRDLDVKSLIGRGYNSFWHFRGRYRVVKGGRGSKKSYTMAYWVIIMMMAYPLANTMIIRKVEKTHRLSTFSLMQKVIWNLGVQDIWRVYSNTLTIVNMETGQEIRFVGLDNPLKLTSSDVKVGILCWVWFEEAYEVTKYEDFAIVDESIRGEIPEGSGLWKQITMTFNPWRPCWLKTEFFDKCDPENPAYDPVFAEDCLCLTTTHKINEWLDERDHAMYERLKETNPRRYEVAALGNWGTPGDVIFENWDVVDLQKTQLIQILARYPAGIKVCGLDFGFEHSTALVAMFLDKKSRQLWIYDEIVLKHSTNRDIGRALSRAGYSNHLIIADSADPKAIEELRFHHGFRRIMGARKGPDSVAYGIQYLRQYQIHIFKDCIQTQTEISMYCYETDPVTGELTENPLKENDDCMDAMRYGTTYIARMGGFMANSRE